LAEFSYNNSTHSSTTFSPFFATYGFHPRSDNFSQLSQQPPTLPNPAAVLLELRSELESAQTTYKRFADQHRSTPPTFEIGSKVWLRATHIRTQRPSKKLDSKLLGPFPIIAKVGELAYRLQLPPSMKIHNVFHVSLLEPFFSNPFPGRDIPAPTPVVVDSEEELVVDEILDSKLIHRHGHYLVKWLGVPFSEATWEPFENCVFSASGELYDNTAVSHYHTINPSKPGPWH
jgi:hypothetical protein